MQTRSTPNPAEELPAEFSCKIPIFYFVMTAILTLSLYSSSEMKRLGRYIVDSTGEEIAGPAHFAFLISLIVAMMIANLLVSLCGRVKQIEVKKCEGQ